MGHLCLWWPILNEASSRKRMGYLKKQCNAATGGLKINESKV